MTPGWPQDDPTMIPNEGQIMPKSCPNHAQIMSESCPNHAQIMPSSCPKDAKIIPKSFNNHPKINPKSVFSRHDSLKILIQIAFRDRIRNLCEKSVWKSGSIILELQIWRSWWPKREIFKPFWHFCCVTLSWDHVHVCTHVYIYICICTNECIPSAGRRPATPR